VVRAVPPHRFTIIARIDHMRATLRLAAGLAGALLATSAVAHDYKVGDLEIGHPYAFVSTGKTAAGYFSVENAGAVADRLVAVKTAFPRAEVHATETDATGVARMTAVQALDIPAGGSVSLAPGGIHVMFMGLSEPLAAGDHVPATLVFENAGEIEVDFHVQARDGAGSDMPGMSH
jgi:periplasmic copper chaperone A